MSLDHGGHIWMVYIMCWYFSGVSSTLVNKALLGQWHHPMLLTSLHVWAGFVLDYVVLRRRKSCPKLCDRKMIVACLPIMLLLLLSKGLTYTAYDKIAASLTHTIKASSPVWNVLLTYIVYKRLPPALTCLSLVPIVLGVVMSASSSHNQDHSSEIGGIIAAFVAALAGVSQTMYTKQLLQIYPKVDAILLHMFTSIGAVFIMGPYVIVRCSYLVLVDDQPSALSWWLLQMLCASLCMHYMQNISSMLFLSTVPTLTHQVASVLRRLLNIVGAVLFFHTEVYATDAFGIALALAGFAVYSRLRVAHKTKNDAKGADVPDLESGLHKALRI